MFKYLYVFTKNIINFYMLPQELPRFVLVVVKFQHCFQPPLPEPEVFVGGMRPWGCPQAIRWMILAPVKRWLEVTGDYRRIASSGKKLFTYHTMLHRFSPFLCLYIYMGLFFFCLLPALLFLLCRFRSHPESALCTFIGTCHYAHVQGRWTQGLKDGHSSLTVGNYQLEDSSDAT